MLTPAEHGMRFGGLTWQNGELLAIREAHDGSQVPHRIDRAHRPRWVRCDQRSSAKATSSHSPRSRRVAGTSHGSRGTTPTCPGTGPSCGWGGSKPASSSNGRRSPEGAARRCSPCGSTMTICCTPTTRPDAGTCGASICPPTSSVTPIAPADADTGGPLWVLGTRWFGRLDDGRIVAVRTNGDDELVLIDTDGTVTPLPAIRHHRGLRRGCAGHARARLGRLARTRRARCGRSTSITRRRPSSSTADRRRGEANGCRARARSRSTARRVRCTRSTTRRRTPTWAAPEGEQPAVSSCSVHGGPTTHRGGAASGRIAYFTSRGIGVLDVNYGGSSGYGRAYRERLRGQWGVVDVQDVATAAVGCSRPPDAADAARLDDRRRLRGRLDCAVRALVGTDAFTGGHHHATASATRAPWPPTRTTSRHATWTD